MLEKNIQDKTIKEQLCKSIKILNKDFEEDWILHTKNYLIDFIKLLTILKQNLIYGKIVLKKKKLNLFQK